MKLFAQSALLSAAQLSEKVLSFVVIIIASRLLNAEGVGEFFYYFSLVSLFLPVMDLGFDKLFLQQWYGKTDDERRETLTSLLALKFIMVIPTLIGACALDYVLQYSNPNPTAVLFCFLAIYLQGVGQLLRRPAFARGKVKYDIGIPIIEKALCVIGVVIFISDFQSGWQIAYVYAGAHAVGALLSIPGFRGVAPTSWGRLRLRRLVKLGIAGIPFSLSTFFVMVSLYVDSVMLGMFSFEEVGLYGAAYRVIVVVMGLSGGTCRALFPKLAQLRTEGRTSEASDVFRSILRIHMMLFGTIAIGGIVMGPRLMEMIYGSEFLASGLAFQLLAPLILLASITNVSGNALEAVGEQNKVMKITMKAAGFNVAANIVLIPTFGMVGAALTTICTELAALIFQAKILKGRKDLPWRYRAFVRPLIFLIVMAILYSPLAILAGKMDSALPMVLSNSVAIGLGIIAASIVAFLGRNYWLEGLIPFKRAAR